MSKLENKQLKTIQLPDFVTESGFAFPLQLSYQIFGLELGTAPIVLVNHALTGNSNVVGKNGWWNQLIGKEQTIDTERFTILAFNIPGNGYENDESLLIDAYLQFTTRDIATAFVQALEKLKIDKLYAVIGGSLGGCLSWDILTLKPTIAEHAILIATDWKATDWLIANVRVQKQILEHSDHALEDARMHAMTFYRSAASFKQKFERSLNHEQGLFNIETWLAHHGKKLKNRFTLRAYKMLNHLLSTTDITRGKKDFAEAVQDITSTVHLVNINTDGLYVADETRDTFQRLKKLGKDVQYHEIVSIHGHDAFLIEYDQLNNYLKDIFSEKHKEIDNKLQNGDKNLQNTSSDTDRLNNAAA